MAESNNLPEDNYRSESTGDIRLENDILKLKLLAESGATIESDSNLSPELENKFLQQVLQFEYALQNVKYVKVYELLGQPSYKMEQELSDGEILEELNRLEEILYEHNIHLDVQGEYEPRTIYRLLPKNSLSKKLMTCRHRA